MFLVLKFNGLSRSVSRWSVTKPQVTCIANFKRNFSDTPNVDPNSKQVVMQGPENEERVRVRRAQAADVPRVLRFVREHARSAWPGLAPPPSASHLVLSDYVSRALAQGHSMLAEQQEAKSGWGKICGLALNTALSPWDPVMLERWARCVRCARSRRLINFTAHCFRAPALHDKYQVHNILQVTLIIPLETPKTTELINILAKNSIQRGRDMGFRLIRFDVSSSGIANTLEQLQLKKDWQLSYKSVLDQIKDDDKTNDKEVASDRSNETEETKISKSDGSSPEHFMSVYTSHVPDNKQKR